VRYDPGVDPNAEGLTAGPAKADHAQLEHPLPLTQDHWTTGIVLTRVLAPAASIVGAELAGSDAGVKPSSAHGIIHGQQGGLLQGVRLGGSEAQGSPPRDVYILIVEATLSAGILKLIFKHLVVLITYACRIGRQMGATPLDHSMGVTVWRRAMSLMLPDAVSM